MHSQEQTITERVTAIVVDQLGVNDDQVTNTSHLRQDLGADSLDCVELIMALEDEFDIEIPDEDAEAFQTVGAAISYVERQQTA